MVLGTLESGETRCQQDQSSVLSVGDYEPSEPKCGKGLALGTDLWALSGVENATYCAPYRQKNAPVQPSFLLLER